MSMKINDGAGKIAVSVMRDRFEKMVNTTPSLKKNTPLGIMEVNGQFYHYMDPDTDTLWIGFALGMRMSERIALLA